MLETWFTPILIIVSIICAAWLIASVCEFIFEARLAKSLHDLDESLRQESHIYNWEEDPESGFTKK